MRPDFLIPFDPPVRKGAAQTCSSFDVCFAFGLGALAASFMQGTERERRHMSIKGRRWDAGGDQLPLYLYKYRHLETDDPSQHARDALLNRARDLLVHGQVWVASTDSLNDLHDMRFNVEQSSDPNVIDRWLIDNVHLLRHMPPARRIALREVLRRRKLLPNDIAEFRASMEKAMGVFCASQDPRNEPMWAHYAADHKGFCVQFDTSRDELFLLAEKALYTSTFPTITLPHADRRDSLRGHLSKSTAWSYEREWRVVIPQNNFGIRLRTDAIAGVILGAKASERTRDAIHTFNLERKNAGYRPFNLYQARQHRDRFGMCISKVKAVV